MTNDRELEQALRRLARERVNPRRELLEKTKARLRRSRLLPWLMAASIASQVGSMIGGFWLLFIVQASWLLKGLWLSGIGALLGLPLALLALHLPDCDLPGYRVRQMR